VSELEWCRWDAVPPLGVTLQFWTPPEAEAQFLKAFHLYGGVHR
jgi:hypothetical protein